MPGCLSSIIKVLGECLLRRKGSAENSPSRLVVCSSFDVCKRDGVVDAAHLLAFSEGVQTYEDGRELGVWEKGGIKVLCLRDENGIAGPKDEMLWVLLSSKKQDQIVLAHHRRYGLHGFFCEEGQAVQGKWTEFLLREAARLRGRPLRPQVDAEAQAPKRTAAL